MSSEEINELLLPPDGFSAAANALVVHDQPQLRGSEISLHALAGQINPQTIKVTGLHKGHSLSVLIDSSSTYNFFKHSLIS